MYGCSALLTELSSVLIRASREKLLGRSSKTAELSYANGQSFSLLDSRVYAWHTCAVHPDSATTSIRLVGMQIACASCWLSAKFVATHLVYSVLTNCKAYPRCVPLSYIHSCMPGNSADGYSGLDLLFSYVCHNAFDSVQTQTRWML